MASGGQLPPLGSIQGVALIDRVVALVRTDPSRISALCRDYPLHSPRPLPASVLDTLTFPGGKPLAPSLKRWLAFDASWLHELAWFSSTDATDFAPRRLDDILEAEFACWGDAFAPLSRRFPRCFLLPSSDGARYIYAVCEPDDTGECPVLVVETGDMPYVGVMYPGFDVYMAVAAGLDDTIGDTPDAIFDDPRYASRMRQHASHLFHGKHGIECFDAEWDEP